MWRMKVPVWTPLVHCRRLRGDIEGEAMRRIPNCDWLDERASGEFAITHGADAVTFEMGALRIGDARAKEPGVRLWQFREADDVRPDSFRWRVNFDGRDDFKERLGRDHRVRASETGKDK